MMEFFYRSLPGGRCEVVCTRCFLTLGSAGEIDEIRCLEDLHHCTRQTPAISGRSVPPQRRPQLVSVSAPRPLESSSMEISPLRKLLLLVAVCLVLYVLPTAFEFSVLPDWNPWFATILPGDLLGCLCLATVFRRFKMGVVLYGVLTIFESLIYVTGIAPVRLIPWFTDLLPTLAVAGIVLRDPARSPRLVPVR